MEGLETGIPLDAERGLVNFSNIVLQPESIKSYFKNPDSTWTYLVRWKDIWLHESLCVSFTDIIEDFWNNAESHPLIAEHAVNKQATAMDTCGITTDNTCRMTGDKVCDITDNGTFSITGRSSCNEGNVDQVTNGSMSELTCSSQMIAEDDEGTMDDVTNCEDSAVNLSPVETSLETRLGEAKDNLKEMNIDVPFEQALSELDGESRSHLLQTLNDIPVTVNGVVIPNTLNYQLTNNQLQTEDDSVSSHQQGGIVNNLMTKIKNSGQKPPKSNRNVPIECDICHKVLSSRNSLREHRITVHLKNGRFPCEECGKRFTHQRALRLHGVMHMKDRNYVCQICSSSHKRERELELHMRDMHTMSQNYRCDVCFQCFKMKGSLKSHCFTAHENTVTNCIVCEQKLTTPFSIYTHCLKHAEPREFKCTQCEREFKSKTQLKKHTAVHDPEKRPYKQCPKCLKLIFSRSHYYEHVNSHDNDTNEIIRFKCTSCDASFQHSSSLKRHRIRHRPGGDLEYPKQNPYIHMDEAMLPGLCCKRCRKLYTSKSGYYEHIKRCRDGVPTEELCFYCNKMYSSRKTLNRHIRNKHSLEGAVCALYDKNCKLEQLEEHGDITAHIVTIVQNNELAIHSAEKNM